jgi:hypothetical protein
VFDSGDSQLSVDATEGRRGTTTLGDRMMVALAAVALLGGAVIGVGKLLPPSDSETSAATPTALPSATASPTRRPAVKLEKPLVTFRVGQEALPPLPAAEPYWEGWARVLRRVNEYVVPGLIDEPVATLREGDIVWATDDPSQNRYGDEWLLVSAPIRGYIHQTAGHGSAVERVIPRADYGVGVQSIIAGPDGQFLLFGWRWPNALLGFTDGDNAWQAVEPPGMLERLSWFDAAYGPAGWIAVVAGERYDGRPWVWQSDDGRAWHPLGRLEGLERNVDGWRIAGSELGYVMTPAWRSSQTDDDRIWYSPDGSTWTQRPIPVTADSLVATPIGFYAYAQGEVGTVGAFSADGWDWSSADQSGFRGLIGVAGTPDGFVALDREGASVQGWVAEPNGATLTWERATQGNEFDGAVVTGLPSGPAAMAMGFERGTERALWWSHDAQGWHRHELPDSFGTIPRLGSASEGGYALVGAGPSPIAEDPVIWGSARTSLRPEARPFIRPVGAPTSANCAAARPELVELMSNSTLVFAECHGDVPLTMTAYLARCTDCGDYSDDRTLRPEWLADPYAGHIMRLSPIASADWSWFEVVRAPSLRYPASWEGHWVTVTGHFDDPAATDCREILNPDTEVWYGGRNQLVRDCRGRFVVTRMALAPKPG